MCFLFWRGFYGKIDFSLKISISHFANGIRRESSVCKITAMAKILIKHDFWVRVRPVYQSCHKLNETHPFPSPPLTSLQALSLRWFLSNSHSLFTFAFLHCVALLIRPWTLGTPAGLSGLLCKAGLKLTHTKASQCLPPIEAHFSSFLYVWLLLLLFWNSCDIQPS